MKDEQPVLTIKRYRNRKLYDIQRSCYVTLDEIGNMIREGMDVRVLDNKSNEDMTAIILAQIICAGEKKKKPILPLSALKNIIQNSGHVFQEIENGFIKGVFQKTQDLSKNFEDKIKTAAHSFSQVLSLQNEIRKLRQKILFLEKKLRTYEK